jgi:integrase
LRPSGYYGRFWAVVDGERIRVTKALGTTNRQAAKVKLARLIAEAAANPGKPIDARRVENFREAATRIHELRKAVIARKSATNAWTMLRNFAFEVLGDMAVNEIEPTDINSVYDAMKTAGLVRDTVLVGKRTLSAAFSQLVREGVVKENIALKATLPTFKQEVVKERAVLSDDELGTYLQWEHPVQRYRRAVIERQTMAVIARCFGGARTGDLHVMRWEALDVEGGAFTWGRVPRAKTKRPQLLEVPSVLRPTLRHWWELSGKPSVGLMFPVAHHSTKGRDRLGEQRISSSHARGLRLDLQRARVAEPGTARWRELFTETPETLPIDFHSTRRSFAQALADGGATHQEALALTAHADMKTHARYLQSSGKMRRMPEAALPRIKALAKGTGDAQAHQNGSGSDGLSAATQVIVEGWAPHVPRARGCAQEKGDQNMSDSSDKAQGASDEKAPRVPFGGALRALPASAHFGLIDVLRAAREAHARGEHARVGSLIEAALCELEPAQAATSKPGISSKRPRPRQSR